jgi:hypothetical protein
VLEATLGAPNTAACCQVRGHKALKATLRVGGGGRCTWIKASQPRGAALAQARGLLLQLELPARALLHLCALAPDEPQPHHAASAAQLTPTTVGAGPRLILSRAPAATVLSRRRKFRHQQQEPPHKGVRSSLDRLNRLLRCLYEL